MISLMGRHPTNPSEIKSDPNLPSNPPDLNTRINSAASSAFSKKRKLEETSSSAHQGSEITNQPVSKRPKVSNPFKIDETPALYLPFERYRFASFNRSFYKNFLFIPLSDMEWEELRPLIFPLVEKAHTIL